MKFIAAHNGQLQTLSEAAAGVSFKGPKSFKTGLDAIDALAPKQSLIRGAVHELLFSPADGQPKLVAALFARAAAQAKDEGATMKDEAVKAANSSFILHPSSLPIIWSNPTNDVYPPALANLGFDLSRLYLLHPISAADEAWAVTECLRCRGVGAVVASPQGLTRIEARRFQLAAETGGSVGILLRPTGRGDAIYAAATRWLVKPCRGERTIQRWTIQLLHGHGGRIGQTVFVEWCRENNSVRALEKLPDRQTATPAAERSIAIRASA